MGFFDARFGGYVVVAALLIVTPGPDTALVTRHALLAGRRAASFTTFGIGVGSILWALASVLGIAVLLERSVLIFSVWKLLGPESLQVIVASNLFGDILTDLGAAISGSLGLAPSANINPQRRYPSLFQAIHGSAPDIAGKGIANPIASIWSGQLLLDHLDEQEAAAALLRSIEEVLAAGQVRTPDLSGNSTTRQMGEAVRTQLRKIVTG